MRRFSGNFCFCHARVYKNTFISMESRSCTLLTADSSLTDLGINLFFKQLYRLHNNISFTDQSSACQYNTHLYSDALCNDCAQHIACRSHWCFDTTLIGVIVWNGFIYILFVLNSVFILFIYFYMRWTSGQGLMSSPRWVKVLLVPT